ncbi:hypothetical protein BH24ACI5_BH24ACI5_19930 [soil metagenome]
MKRSLITCALAVPMAALLCSPLAADVRTREKTLIKFEGMLGRVVGLFGGKAAREGIVSTTAVRGDRKSTMSDNSGQIIDLGEEKVYDLDLKKKEYRVTTFDELRRRMKEAREKAEKEVAREEGRGEQEKQEKQEPTKEWEVDFDAKETGQTKQIVGHNARQVIMTVTLREKGKTLDDSGGIVMLSDTWFGPDLPALKELSDFDLRYYKKLYGEESFGLAAEQMAMVMAMYPMMKQASERLKSEGSKLQGTPLATTVTFEAVKSKAMVAEQSSQESGSGGGGLGGMLARKIKKPEPPKARTTIFTTEHEFQDVATSVDASAVAIPDGFKEKR